jgi:hypothetical protein
MTIDLLEILERFLSKGFIVKFCGNILGEWL